MPRVLTYFALSPFLSQLKSPDPEAPVPSTAGCMAVLAEMLETGNLTPVVDRTYPLEQAPEAMRYLQQGNARGRILIQP